ncbi:MAG: hypothetical protein LBO78_03280 [Rickettsiales bacterium]|jgi:hypothetical protein|nr:hypothetical protein [Rickettsiales bacterium]
MSTIKNEDVSLQDLLNRGLTAGQDRYLAYLLSICHGESEAALKLDLSYRIIEVSDNRSKKYRVGSDKGHTFEWYQNAVSILHGNMGPFITAAQIQLDNKNAVINVVPKKRKSSAEIMFSICLEFKNLTPVM